MALMDMIIFDKDGVIGNELTLQGKNAILHRQVFPFEVKAFPVIGEDGLITAAIGSAIKPEFQASALCASQGGHVMVVGG